MYSISGVVACRMRTYLGGLTLLIGNVVYFKILAEGVVQG